MYVWMNEQVSERASEWASEQMEEWTNDPTDERIEEWMNEHMPAQTGEWVNKWMHAHLQDAIQGVKGQPSKGRQRVLLVVLVMNVVQHPAPPNATSQFKFLTENLSRQWM